MRNWLQILHESVRQLRRVPRFTLFAMVLLGLGLGTSSAVFSLVHAALLQPLPFPDSDRLIGVQAAHRPKGLVQDGVSATDLRDFVNRARSFQHAGGFRPNFASFTRPDAAPQRLITGLVTPGVLDALGVPPLFGRAFESNDFSAAAPRTVLLSHAFWQRQFHGADVLGQVIELDDEPCTIIGVMPERFREPSFVDAWLPFPNESPEYFARDSRFWTMIGRLAPGVTVEQAGAELSQLAADLAREYPDTNRDWSAVAVPLHELRTAGLRTALWLLFGAVVLVLLVACLNLANLLLARGVSQIPEMGVRLALGSTPRRLAWGAIVQGQILALGGGILGIALAAGLLEGASRLLPVWLFPPAPDLRLHLPVLLAGLGLSVVSGFACSLLPAIHLLRLELGAVINEGAGRAGRSGRLTRWQSGLVVAQIGLTFALAGAALLLLRSLDRLQSQPIGFSAEGLVTLRLAPSPHRYETSADLARYYEDVVDAVQAVPGVTSAAVNGSAPFSGISLTYPTWPDGVSRDATQAHDAVYAPVSSDFFRLIRLPVGVGRDFTDHDRAGGHPVAIVNETYARRVFGAGPVLGRQILLLPWMGDTYREIVGVVADLRQESLATPSPPQVYVPQAQMPWFFSTLLMRVEQPGVLPAVQTALRQVDPDLPFAPRSLQEEIADSASQSRLFTQFFVLFGAIALGLSLLGVYATLRFRVSVEQRQIGVRLALGAAPSRVIGWVLARTSRWIAGGLALGVALSLPLALTLRGQLYGVSVADPSTWLLVPAAVALGSLAAALPCAWRAARTDPAVVLRAE